MVKGLTAQQSDSTRYKIVKPVALMKVYSTIVAKEQQLLAAAAEIIHFHLEHNGLSFVTVAQLQNYLLTRFPPSVFAITLQVF